jgi:hypothetical protein
VIRDLRTCGGEGGSIIKFHVPTVRVGGNIPMLIGRKITLTPMVVHSYLIQGVVSQIADVHGFEAFFWGTWYISKSTCRRRDVKDLGDHDLGSRCVCLFHSGAC